MDLIDNKTILTPTSGFLGESYSHSLNPYSGCSFAGTLCGHYCYVQHNRYITKGREWQLYGVKKNAITAYVRDYTKWRNKRTPKPLNIYMASSTDPYIPQEKKQSITRGLLEQMISYPPDVLWVQTRSPLVLRDKDLFLELARKTTLFITMTVETDKVSIEGLNKHSFSPQKRFEAIRQLKNAGLPTKITASPLMPLDSMEVFVEQIDQSCHRVIFDHYLLGDGSEGKRTKRLPLPDILAAQGYDQWLELDTFYEVVQYATSIMGADRVRISKEGFNDLEPITP